MKREVKWVLVVSLILLFWVTWLAFIAYAGYYFRPGAWDYLRNINVLSFIVTVGLATIYTTNFWKSEVIFKATILMFIISISLFFISNMQWIATALFGTTPY